MDIIKILKTTSKIIILTSIVVFSSCSSDDTLIENSDLQLFKTKLKEFEMTLNSNKSINSFNKNINKKSVKSEINEYDSFGLQYSNFLLNLKDYIIEHNIDDLEKNNIEIKNYIESNIIPITGKLSPNNLESSEFEKLVLKSFAKNTNLDNVVSYSKEYEKFVDKNISDISQREKILSTISAYKWVGYNIFYVNSDKIGVSNLKSSTSNKIAIACSRRKGIEYCMCKRIESREADWNWVDTVGFLLTGPQQLAWDLAACTADELGGGREDDDPRAPLPTND